ncbi:MAG: type I restriction enzyme HsdR N-terminal domain-containing protein [Bacteroides sp.]|nr:type I restriction enzyme HsdR N-terminal domain-containing protein [Bacteroides sp.]
MIQLNLPLPADLLVEDLEGGRSRVYDPIRCRWVALTPEEWVRQHFTAWLTAEKGFPRSLMANEVGLRVRGMPKRLDTIVFARDGRTPLCIIEYKAPEVTVTQAVFRQAALYNIVIKAPLLIVSNGLQHYCALVTPGSGKPVYLKDIPQYAELEILLKQGRHLDR